MIRNRAARSPRALTAAQVLALGPTAWWKADDLALADGAAIASWADASGNGWNLAQAVGTKQPTYDADGINGHPAMRGSAANVTALATAAMPAMAPPFTVIMAAKAPTITPTATQYATGGNSSGNRRDLYYTTGRVAGMQGGSGLSGTVTIPADTGYVQTAVFDTATVLRTDSIPRTGAVTTSSPIQIVIGARNGETASFDGWIGEVIYIPRRLTDREIMGVELYLSEKWDIPLTPPGVVYVDGDTGSDTANTGRSPSSPVKTATKASAILGTSDGRIEITGTLREQLAISAGVGARLIKLDNVTWYASEQHTSGWVSAGGGVYSKAVTDYPATLYNVRVSSDLDADGLWTDLTSNTTTPATPGVGQFGFAAGTLYVHLADDADPNTKTIEAAKYDYAIYTVTANEVVVRDEGGSQLLMGNRATINAGSAGTDGKVVCLDIVAGYGGNEGCFATQNDATYFKRYRCESFGAKNDGGNWHGTAGRAVAVYSEDCNDHHNGDEGESAHDSVAHVVRGGWKHHNVGGGGITNVGATTLDADGSAAGPLICENNRTGASAVANQGGISAYEAATQATIGPDVICRDNNGGGIYIHPDSVGSSVDPAAAASSTGNALPDTLP